MLKNYILLVFTCFCTHHIQAQQVRFTYDDSGNRIGQEVICLYSGLTAENLKAKTDTTTLQVQVASELLLLKIYPNPVKDRLTLDFGRDLTSNPVLAKVFSSNGLMICQNTIAVSPT